MSDNMKGLDTFAVGYAAAEAKLQSELEALKCERAMLVEAAKDVAVNVSSYKYHRFIKNLMVALSATEPQATQWLEEKRMEWIHDTLDLIRGQADAGDCEAAIEERIDELRLAASKREQRNG
jgi:hypothetical protein